MIEINIPGRSRTLKISHAAFDFNGTIAADGRLIDGIAERLIRLSQEVHIVILTADTYGSVKAQCAELPVEVRTFPKEGASAFKKEIVESLGDGVFTVGNGFNDIQMFDAAELSVAVLEQEGMCSALLTHSDVLVRSPLDAIDLLLEPNRLRATLRS